MAHNVLHVDLDDFNRFGESNGEEGCEFVCKKLGASLREISGNKRIFEGN